MAQYSRPPTRQNIQKLRGLGLDDFQYQGPLQDYALSSHRDSTAVTDSEKTAYMLLEARDRFSKGIPIDGNHLCYSVDRAAVLDVYCEALEKINRENHRLVLFETTLKVKTILGLRSAEPHDIAFACGGMLLKPIEPQYAEPRIEFDDDQEGYRMAWRLKAWRKEGWPDKYPIEAVIREQDIEKLTPKGGQKDADLRNKMKNWDEEDWGDEVDALPGSCVEQNDTADLPEVKRKGEYED